MGWPRWRPQTKTCWSNNKVVLCTTSVAAALISSGISFFFMHLGSRWSCAGDLYSVSACTNSSRFLCLCDGPVQSSGCTLIRRLITLHATLLNICLQPTKTVFAAVWVRAIPLLYLCTTKHWLPCTCVCVMHPCSQQMHIINHACDG